MPTRLCFWPHSPLISAVEKLGGLLAPYFASRVSEAMSNLAEVAEETTIEPLQHVAGPLNPADIQTRCTTTPDDVREGSVWQDGPSYLRLDRKDWPFSRDFLDVVPDQELRAPKATFNLASSGVWKSPLGSKLTRILMDIMDKSNCYQKTVHVTARFLKSVWDQDRGRIREALTVDDILVARIAQFQVSMGPTVVDASNGELDCLRPVEKGGIIYIRGRCDKSIPSILGV